MATNQTATDSNAGLNAVELPRDCHGDIVELFLELHGDDVDMDWLQDQFDSDYHIALHQLSNDDVDNILDWEAEAWQMTPVRGAGW